MNGLPTYACMAHQPLHHVAEPDVLPDPRPPLLTGVSPPDRLAQRCAIHVRPNGSPVSSHCVIWEEAHAI